MDEQYKILVVDDNPLVSGVVSTLLRQANYQVLVANNGKEALDVLEDKVVDLILCDVMMPQMDGYELYDTLRGHPANSHTPFVFLTALDQKFERAKGSELGIDDYLVKPFEPEELLAVVRGKLKRAGASKEQYNSYRKQVLHTLSHELRTPLVAINTGAELLIDQSKKEDEATKTVQLLEAIRRSGARLEKLVSDFIQLQQIEAGITERIFNDRKSQVQISSLVNMLVKRWSAELKDKGFTIALRGSAEDSHVEAFEPHLVEALGRIIENSVKFSDNTKEIMIEIGPKSITIHDRGCGFEPSKVKKLLSEFQQHGRDKREQQGAGLGLVIASKLLSIAGAALDFEQREGGGSSVRVSWP